MKRGISKVFSMIIGTFILIIMLCCVSGLAAEVEYDLPDGAIFEEIDWANATVYAYTPSELYNPSTMMTPVIFVYPDQAYGNMDDAWSELNETGLLELAETEHAGIFLMNPADETWSSADTYVWMEIATSLTTVDNNIHQMTYFTYLNLVYAIGEGSGATFINQYLTRNERASVIAGVLTFGGELGHVPASLPSREISYDYALPAYIVGGTEETIEFYKEINDTNASVKENGTTVYYNDPYDQMKVIVNETDTSSFDQDIINDAWYSLLRRTARGQLREMFWTKGVSKLSVLGGTVLTERPYVDELGLVVNEKISEGETARELEEKNISQSRWYEWIPNEVYETMASETDQTLYPVIFVYHGGGDHPIFEAESQGWVELAGTERIIVIAPEDNDDVDNNARFIDYICENYPIDLSRIYLTGFSKGAVNTINTTAAYMDKFAAAAPMAYSGEGYQQRWPYEEYEWDLDAIDLPLLYTCGTNDVNNLMTNPIDASASRVFSAQLLVNDVLTVNNMTDQLIDNDALDFEEYPFFGYDVSDRMEVIYTVDGQEVDIITYENEKDQIMMEYLVLPDVSHDHYTAYAEIIWDFFDDFARDPESKAILSR